MQTETIIGGAVSDAIDQAPAVTTMTPGVELERVRRERDAARDEARGLQHLLDTVRRERDRAEQEVRELREELACTGPYTPSLISVG